MELFKKDVKKNPDSYQYERAKKFKVSTNNVLYALRRLKMNYKKNPVSSPRKTRKKRKEFQEKIE